MRAKVTVPVHTEIGDRAEIRFELSAGQLILHLNGISDTAEYLVIDGTSLDQVMEIMSILNRAEEVQDGN